MNLLYTCQAKQCTPQPEQKYHIIVQDSHKIIQHCLSQRQVCPRQQRKLQNVADRAANFTPGAHNMWLKRFSVTGFYTSLFFLLAQARLLQKLQKRSRNRARSKRKAPKMIPRQSLWRLKPTACPSCPSLGRLKLPACSSCLLSWRRCLFKFRGSCPTSFTDRPPALQNLPRTASDRIFQTSFKPTFAFASQGPAA